MGNSLLLEMLHDKLHGRVVSKGSILLIETEMCWVEVEDQGRWLATEFSEDMFSCTNLTESVRSEPQKSSTSIPCGSFKVLGVRRPSATLILPFERACDKCGRDFDLETAYPFEPLTVGVELGDNTELEGGGRGT